MSDIKENHKDIDQEEILSSPEDQLDSEISLHH